MFFLNNKCQREVLIFCGQVLKDCIVSNFWDLRLVRPDDQQRLRCLCNMHVLNILKTAKKCKTQRNCTTNPFRVCAHRKTSRVTRVTLVLWIGNSTLRSLRIGNDIPNTSSWKCCLSGPKMNQQHTVGSNRQDLRTWSRINVKAVKPDKGVRRGPSCRNTNILQGYSSKKSLRGGYASSRMRPKTKRWREFPRLVSQRNAISHPVRNSLLWRGKPAATSTKTDQ